MAAKARKSVVLANLLPRPSRWPRVSPNQASAQIELDWTMPVAGQTIRAATPALVVEPSGDITFSSIAISGAKVTATMDASGVVNRTYHLWAKITIDETGEVLELAEPIVIHANDGGDY